MEPAPSTSRPLELEEEAFGSPPMKRKKTHFSESEKMMIINVFKYVKESWPDDKYLSKNEMKEKAADILGISRSAIYRILKEYAETETVKSTPPKKRPTIIEKINDCDKSCIRRIVNSFYLKGEMPTAKKVLPLINADESLPNMGLTSLKKLLKHLRLEYEEQRRNELMNRDNEALLRNNYLKNINMYRQQKRPIYYLDETWVNAGHTVGCVDTTVQSRKQAFLEGLSSCAKNPACKNRQIIALHIGGEKGFVPESELIFECKGTVDRNELMNAVMFENWFKAVLPRLEPNAVVVMDNASYHSRLMSFEIQETKVQLEKVKDVKTQYQSYVVDEMAKAVGVEILRLPPYHYELNPIELVWAVVKGYMAKKNTSFKIADVKKLLQEAISNITVEKWQYCINHVKKQELKLSRLDVNVDKTDDSFVLYVTGETSESSSDTDKSDSDF